MTSKTEKLLPTLQPSESDTQLRSYTIRVWSYETFIEFNSHRQVFSELNKGFIRQHSHCVRGEKPALGTGSS
jgi:hypothetical protein